MVEELLLEAQKVLEAGNGVAYKLLTELAYRALDLPKPLIVPYSLEYRIARARMLLKRGLYIEARRELLEYTAMASRLSVLEGITYLAVTLAALAATLLNLGFEAAIIVLAASAALAAYLRWKPLRYCTLGGLRR